MIWIYERIRLSRSDWRKARLVFFITGIFILSACAASTPASETQTPLARPDVTTTLPASPTVQTSLGEPAGSPTIDLAASPLSSQSVVKPGITPPEQAVPTSTLRQPSATPDYTPTPDTRPTARNWRTWPVLPVVSQRAIDIYQQGLAVGNDPRVFSIIGDCQSEPPVFLGIYSTDRYYLGDDYQYLEETIAQFQGNYDRLHTTVKNGLSVASVFSPLWAPKDVCQPGETPLDCEFRLYKPSIVFINLGTNWTNGDGYTHEVRLREVVDYVIARGALPILSTKADNHEGDQSINLTTAQIAYDYDIPLWNFWSAVQSLPNKGLDLNRTDNNYLTTDAWSVRSFTGLRALDRVWRTVNHMAIP